MILYGRNYNQILLNLKKHLMEKTGYPFNIDTCIECEFMYEGKKEEFMFYYDYNNQTVCLSFESDFWDDQKEELAKCITKETANYLQDQGIDCFLTTDSDYYLDTEEITGIDSPYVYEFRYVPIGEKAKKIMHMLEVIPTKKNYYQTNIFLDKKIYQHQEIELIPFLEEEGKIKALIRDHFSSPSHQDYEMEMEHTVAHFRTIGEYDSFMEEMEEKQNTIYQMEKEMHKYAIEKGFSYEKEHKQYHSKLNSYSQYIRLHFGDDYYANGFKESSRFYTKEEVLRYMKKQIDYIAEFDEKLYETLEKVKENITTSYLYKDVSSHCSNHYKVYIGEQLRDVRPSIHFKTNEMDGNFTCDYQLGFEEKKENFETANALFEHLYKVLKKEDQAVRLRHLMDSEKVEHLPRLYHELGYKEMTFFHSVPLEVIKKELKKFYQQKGNKAERKAREQIIGNLKVSVIEEDNYIQIHQAS